MWVLPKCPYLLIPAPGPPDSWEAPLSPQGPGQERDVAAQGPAGIPGPAQPPCPLPHLFCKPRPLGEGGMRQHSRYPLGTVLVPGVEGQTQA